MILKIKLAFVLFLFGSIATAQTELSASNAVFKALENNYQIKIASKQLEIGQKNNSWSQAGAFPTVTLSVANNNVITDNTNNPFTFTPGIILNQSINPSLGLNWNIFSGFAVQISKQRLSQLEEQSANNAMAILESTVQDVLKAYYTAQLQEERKSLFSSVLELSRKRMTYYEVKEKYANASSLELMQFKNQYITDSINYLVQEISAENAMRNLKLLMNDSSDVTFILTDKIDVILNELNLTAAEEEMFANNANLKNQYLALELQKSNTSFQKSFLYPTLSFQAGVNPGWSWIKEIKNNTIDIDTRSLSYYGNLNLRYTLFNNWQNKRAVEVSKIQEEISELNIADMKQSLSSTLKNLIALYNARTKLVDLSSENIVYAEKTFELAQKRFELGTINSIDLTNLQNNYQNVMIQHYEHQFNKLDTYLEIYRMTGKIGLRYTGAE